MDSNRTRSDGPFSGESLKLIANPSGDERFVVGLREVLDVIPDSIILQRHDLSVIWANRAALGTHRTLDEIRGKKCHEIWHALPHPCPSCSLPQRTATRKRSSTIVTHPNGRICELRAIPLATEHGKSLGVVTIVRDVTDKALMEAERDALIEKLGRSNDELAGFSRTAAHDIKNPLIGVRGLANQAARSVAAGRLEKLPEYLRRIGAATDQVLEFLDGLLWHSRSGAELGTIEAVGLDSLLPEVATLLEVYLADNGVRIEIAENLPAIRGDRLRLRQLFLNLLSNAAKFSSGVQGAIVRIQARKEGPWVECEVRDNGIGFDPAFSNKIFGLFEKLDPGTEGVGLGLATARRIVEAHGGTISATSEGPGKGCTVTFRLPAADSSSLDTHPAKKQGRLPI